MATFNGNGDDNTIIGSINDDVIRGKGGEDLLYGGFGNDLISGGGGDDFLFGEDGNDTLIGGAGNDSLAGGDGNDILTGAKGNDTMEGGLGADQFKGGQGIDTADYSSATSGVTVYFHDAIALGYATGDTFVNMENLVGSAYADSLQAGDNGKAFGGAGNDTIYGASYTTGDAAGTIRGDAGYDTLRMDYGNTTAWLQNGQGYDTVDHFVENADNFFIDLSEFGLGNTFDAGELVNSNSHTAIGGNAQFIYDGDDSLLYFDTNGSGAGGQVLIADLTNSTVIAGTLDLGDFEYQV
ncbi:MAG: Ca2+-binding protein toxin-related [Rhizobium sp.]|nr:Ca2+-binding protein toxin-related [Rhizobium sp.]